jgi:hypothetical protein
VNAPSWAQTLRMILWAGVVLGVCSLLWLFWTRRMLLVFSGAAVIWACFALAAVFDHLCRRLNPEE